MNQPLNYGFEAKYMIRTGSVSSKIVEDKQNIFVKFVVQAFWKSIVIHCYKVFILVQTTSLPLQHSIDSYICMSGDNTIKENVNKNNVKI